ncbi:SH3 domain-containing protein [Pseudomaricurvus alcaniphilus]|uniref:SH3 domain-containing protein n=1 Tax=Pseudomaricurvus alcaniphilus TaxID=1166482 RepID=UPI00140AC7D3|nr:SH3 domain-containing protein [Pseudomaricurvus alcaniphilus]NHN37776.1 SH3 domain-containing protein [Pseudomaricurvus alcaniphilus]
MLFNLPTPFNSRRPSLCLALLCGLIAPLLAPVAQAATPHDTPATVTMRSDSDYYSLVVDAALVEVHSGPGRGYPVTYALERGETIHVHRQRTDWLQISDKRGRPRGWVKRGALNNSLDADGSRLLFSDPGWDDYLSRRWEAGVALGDFNGAESLTLNLGFRLTANLSAEVRGSQSTGQFSDNTLVSAAVLHQPFPGWRVSPFFMLGAGVISTRPHATLVQTEDRSDTAMLVGAGAYVYLSRRFVMRLEYNNHLLLTSRDANEEINEWKIGFNVFF